MFKNFKFDQIDIQNKYKLKRKKTTIKKAVKFAWSSPSFIWVYTVYVYPNIYIYNLT